MQICYPIGIQTLHDSILSLHASIVSVHDPSTDPFMHLFYLLNFDFIADPGQDPDPDIHYNPDLAFYFNRIRTHHLKIMRIRIRNHAI
jgi:hypothetical protein